MHDSHLTDAAESRTYETKLGNELWKKKIVFHVLPEQKAMISCT